MNESLKAFRALPLFFSFFDHSKYIFLFYLNAISIINISTLIFFLNNERPCFTEYYYIVDGFVDKNLNDLQAFYKDERQKNSTAGLCTQRGSILQVIMT
jgi:hypothetical protein